jgi:hypothetical protein
LTFSINYFCHVQYIHILFYSFKAVLLHYTTQNGFSFCKQSLHKKTNIIQNITKNIKPFIIEQSWKKIIIWDICWDIHTVLWCSHCKSRRYVAAPSRQWKYSYDSS